MPESLSSGTTVSVTRPFFEGGTPHWPTDILTFFDPDYAQGLLNSGVAVIYEPPSAMLQLLRSKEKTNAVPDTHGFQRKNPPSDSLYNPTADVANG